MRELHFLLEASNVFPVADRTMLSVRLLPEDYDRVSKAARRRGLSRAAFVTDAALKECADLEEERRLRRQRKSGFVPEGEEETSSQRQGGLGIREALTKKNAPNDIDEQKPAAPVVVNVNTGASASNPIIENLATFVIKGGPGYMRDMRRRQCDGILRTSAASEEERRQLGAALDAAVKAHDAKQSSTQSTLSKLKSFFE